MRIAFPTRDDLSISGHFGKMKALIVVDVLDGKETSRERRDMSEMPACGNGHLDKRRFVVDKISDCDVLVAGGMGAHMRDTSTEAGINVILTRERLIERALESYLDGTLTNEPQLAHSPDNRVPAPDLEIHAILGLFTDHPADFGDAFLDTFNPRYTCVSMDEMEAVLDSGVKFNL